MPDKEEGRINYGKAKWIFNNLTPGVCIPKLIIRGCGIVLFVHAFNPSPIGEVRVAIDEIGGQMQVGAINIIGEDVVGKMVRQLPDEPEAERQKKEFVCIFYVPHF